ncbi:serine/arginine repetitive matrix protein 3-like [Pan paniscus]|uniref:serine/arginine repetitive matrix protein 3-like n=1 Tax=Pan paniscus TaxID=9597 RepID=UPI0025464658|nr:serine/arginine repetitive matrix protein 3-like [Pan paniscus]
MPSSSRTSKMLAGSSSTPQPTRMRHSGQRSSWREHTMLSRQRRQKVCWHGSTLAVVSRRSRHTEHSSRSSSDDSSMSSPAPAAVAAARRRRRSPGLSSSPSLCAAAAAALDAHSQDAPSSMGEAPAAVSRGCLGPGAGVEPATGSQHQDWGAGLRRDFLHPGWWPDARAVAVRSGSPTGLRGGDRSSARGELTPGQPSRARPVLSAAPAAAGYTCPAASPPRAGDRGCCRARSSTGSVLQAAARAWETSGRKCGQRPARSPGRPGRGVHAPPRSWRAAPPPRHLHAPLACSLVAVLQRIQQDRSSSSAASTCAGVRAEVTVTAGLREGGAVPAGLPFAWAQAGD